MSYIEESLSKDESIVALFPHHGIISFLVALNFLFAVLTMGIWLLPALYFWLDWRCVEQGLTNKRVISKRGIISRNTAEMRLSAIESISIRQGIIGRIFGFGQVVITGRGTGDVYLYWMADPMGVKRKIEDHEEG